MLGGQSSPKLPVRLPPLVLSGVHPSPVTTDISQQHNQLQVACPSLTLNCRAQASNLKLTGTLSAPTMQIRQHYVSPARNYLSSSLKCSREGTNKPNNRNMG